MATSYCPACLNTFQGSPPRCPNMGCGRDRPHAGWGRIMGPGDLIDRHYRIERVLALGGAGLTYLARAIDTGGHPVEPPLAIKVLFEERASGSFLRRLANEAQLLQDLDHDHIVRSRGFVQRAGQPPYLVTLFESGGTLQQHVLRHGKLPPRAACGVLWQVLKALSMAHASSVVHRDLKPANVLLAQPTDQDVTPWVRVADFGIAKVSAPIGAGLTQAGTFIGTPEYAAPEQLEGLPPVPATDLFAAGGLLYFMLTGAPPIRLNMRGDPLAVYEILLEQLPPQLPTLGGDPDHQAILQRVIDHVSIANAEQRWTVPAILAELAPLTVKPERPTAAPAPIQDTAARAEPTMAEWAAGPSVLGAYDATVLEPPPDDVPTRLATQLPAAPAGGATIVDEPPPTVARPTRPAAPTPVAAPPRAAPEPRSKALSLDDLFGGGPATPEPALPARRAPAARPAPPAPVDDDPFAMLGALSKPAPAPEPDDPFALLSPTATRRQAAPAPAPAAPVGPPAGVWVPDQPEALPHPLPASPAALLALLGTIAPHERLAPLEALADLPRPELSRTLRAWRPGGAPTQGRGVGLAIAAIGGSDLASIARNLTRAKDPTVRACAAEALGTVAQGSLLTTLGRMLDDADPTVRAAAARAVGIACVRSGDQTMGLSWLERIAQDGDEGVAQARDEALARLRA
jgi:eukaryotic-like serine/threonine-protein kinase